MRQPEVRGIVVGVPSRDERDHLADCLAALTAAADTVAPVSTVAIVVACDSTTDGSERIVERWARRDARVSAVAGSWGAAGAARRAACAAGLARVAATGCRPRETWIATTDADTLVPADWLAMHVAYATVGVHAVAGIVDLRADEAADAAVATAFARHYPLGRSTHRHVHGANLGVRADAYLRAGGFPPLAVAEDHALWNELQRRGDRCVSSVALRVATSGRLVGRATGGFADTLARVARTEGRLA